MLENQDRNTKIIELLEISKVMDLEALARVLNVSTRTVRTAINDINELLDGVAIINNNGGKLRLYILDNILFAKRRKMLENDYLSMNSPVLRLAHIFVTLINSVGPVILDDLADDLNIGRTTLIYDINKLKCLLKPYRLEIVGKTNSGIHLEGDEFHIRCFLQDHCYQLNYASYHLDHDISDLLNLFFKDNEIEKMTRDNFTKSFVIALDRNINDYPMSKLDSKYYQIKDNPIFQLVSSFCESIAKLLMIEFSEEEMIYIAIPLIGMRTPMSKNARSKIDVSPQTGELVTKILDEIKLRMNFNIIPTDMLEDFMYHLNFMLERLKYEYHLENSTIVDLREKYPVAFKMAQIASEVIYSNTELEVTPTEFNYLTIYLNVMYEQNNQLTNKKKVALVTGDNRITGKMLEMQLRRILPDSTSYQLISDYELADLDSNQFSLLVATRDLDVKIDLPVVKVKEYCDDQELSNSIRRVVYSQHLDFSINTNINSYLVTLLESDRFFLLDHDKDDHQNALMMIEYLQSDGIVNDDFVKAYQKRWQQGSLKVSNAIYFPHFTYQGNHIVLAMGVVPRKKNDSQAKLIFILGLPENDEINDEILFGVYNEILNCSHDPNMIDQISALTSSKEFYLYMINNEAN
ncbi:MAG: PRD domain-containing protein [Erysipelotrichaceae bacterium]|nr:PRD domain-containing protein [Erysipelotrichaceae bacterium]